MTPDVSSQRKPVLRRRIAICLWLAQVAMMMLALELADFDVESIVGTGPVLVAIGLALAIATRPLSSSIVLLFGLSAPTVCALGAFVIASFRLTPARAHAPVVTILTAYVLLSIVPAIVALIQIWRWPVHAFASPPRTWRYSMKTLLGLMTLVAILSTVGASIAKAFYDFPPIFTLFGIISLALAGIVARKFLLERRRLQEIPELAGSSTRGWLDRIRNWGVPVRKRYPQCSFCGRHYRQAAPFAEGRDGALICSQCAITCAELIAKESARPGGDYPLKELDTARLGQESRDSTSQII